MSDLTRHSEWASNPGLKLEQTSPGAVMTGATFSSSGTQYGIHTADEVRVTRFEPPYRFDFEATPVKGPRAGNDYAVHHSFEFEKSEDGTLVRKEMRMVGLDFPFTLITPVAEIVLKRRTAKDLKRIAAKLEGHE